MGETLQRLFSRYLPDSEFVSVRSVDEALLILESAPVQALLINAPPDYEGLERLKELPYGIPAVVFWLPGRDEVARELGIVDYLVKPVSRLRFLDAIERLDDEVDRVLIVDDQPEVLQLFARMLSSAPKDYRVLRASGGRQALHMLRSRKPDVVVLDLIMPDVDGFQVLEEKGRDPDIRDVPVIIISSRDATNAPITSNRVTVVRGEGMSVPNLLACVEAISQILSPVRAPAEGHAGPARPRRPDD
jgi:CheY-like chemotaxis protein